MMSNFFCRNVFKKCWSPGREFKHRSDLRILLFDLKYTIITMSAFYLGPGMSWVRSPAGSYQRHFQTIVVMAALLGALGCWVHITTDWLVSG